MQNDSIVSKLPSQIIAMSLAMENPTTSNKAAFAHLLNEAFDWLARNQKLGSRNYEATFAKICKSEKRTVWRWRQGTLPQRDKWTSAVSGLRDAGLDSDRLASLDAAWKTANYPEKSLSIIEGEVGPARRYTIVHTNPFPKLCFVNLDIPDQGSWPEDFIVIGEIRFARAPDVVDEFPITVGVRRATVLPVVSNCRVKPGSLYRPPVAENERAAAQVFFSAEGSTPTAVLEGDQLKGETFARFISNNEETTDLPRLDVLIQLETPNDLHVALEHELKGRSVAQRKLAERWIAMQIARTVQEPDGGMRLGFCSIRWKAAR